MDFVPLAIAPEARGVPPKSRFRLVRTMRRRSVVALWHVRLPAKWPRRLRCVFVVYVIAFAFSAFSLLLTTFTLAAQTEGALRDGTRLRLGSDRRQRSSWKAVGGAAPIRLHGCHPQTPLRRLER